MNHASRLGMGMAILVLAGLVIDCAAAQPGRPAAARPAAGRARPVAVVPTTTTEDAWFTPGLPFRRLAPGVMKEVILDHRATETVERHPITELLYINDTFDFAKDVTFRHEVWMLEFKYKPLRMIWAEVPGPDARMQRKQIWYMLYQVTNPGKAFVNLPDDKLYKLVPEDKPVRFSPVFTLEVHNLLRKEADGTAKAFVEQYIPIALPAIRAREDKNREFLPSAQMPQKELRVGETVWGVATWTDIDPNNVWFSVYVEGLTNAYKFTDDPAKYAATQGKGLFREIRTKVLKINFWRPGDEYTVRETQVRTGVPELPNGPSSRPPFEWVWWKTFPPSATVVPPAE